MKHNFVVNDKNFEVDIELQKINGETKYFFNITRIYQITAGNAEPAKIPQPIDLLSISPGEDIPEYYNSHLECMNWAHNWVERNHDKL